MLLGIRKATTSKSLVLSPYTAALCGFKKKFVDFLIFQHTLGRVEKLIENADSRINFCSMKTKKQHRKKRLSCKGEEYEHLLYLQIRRVGAFAL